jgi:hypothetical protein
MEARSVAETLPALYRAILDEVAELELRGARDEGARTRSAAIRVYSRAWDDRGRRELEEILRRARRTTGRVQGAPTKPSPAPTTPAS